MSTPGTPGTPASRPLPALEDFADLVGSLLDGTISAADHPQIDHAIATSAEHRAEYRAIASIESLIAWDRRWAATSQQVVAAPRSGSLKRATPWTRAVYSLAAALLLAAAAVAIWLASSNPQSEIRNPKSNTASVLDVSDDATLMIDDQIAQPGEEYAGGSISLDAGEAEFMLPRRIAVRLRGATKLTVHDSMSATLERGSAAFDCPHDAKGYTVHLPGGYRIVDLGTQFDVDLNARGVVTTTVTEGIVEIHYANGPAERLEAGQSARYAAGGVVLDVADIVAGGDGLGMARGSGIDLASGQRADGATKPFRPRADGGYRRVEHAPLIDGVFIPDGEFGPVQIDSTGRQISDLPDTAGLTYGPLWSGAPLPVESETARPISTVIAGVDYSRGVRGLVSMIPNRGITIDLHAIAATHGCAARRFTTTLAHTFIRDAEFPTDATTRADFRIYVDGELRRHATVSLELDPIEIDIEIDPADRFLCLVATDGGDTIHADWLMLGDPMIWLESLPARPHGHYADDGKVQLHIDRP